MEKSVLNKMYFIDKVFDPFSNLDYGCVNGELIELMTHEEGVPYMDYVENIKSNPIAREVKLADLRHNSDLSRLDAPTEKDKMRVDKYRKAIELLDE